MAAPEAFEEEVLSLAGLSEVRVDPRSSVVGFTAVGSAERAFEHAARELEVRGWTSIDSGSTTCGSFVKGEGRYRWAFVSCVQVGSTTSVVVQSVSEDEGKR